MNTITLLLHGGNLEIVRLEPNTGTHKIESKRNFKIPTEDYSWMSGIAAFVEGHLLALYRFDQCLYVLFEKKRILINSSVKSAWSKTNLGERFQLFVHEESVIDITYSVPEVPKEVAPFVLWGDYESRDFLLWLHRVLSSAERQDVLIQEWKGNDLESRQQ